MVAGRPPFTGDNPVSIAYKQVHDAPQPLNQLVADVPRPFEAIVAKLLAKKPEVRYPTAEALREDLRRFRNGEPVQALAAAAAPAAGPVRQVVAGGAATAALPRTGPVTRTGTPAWETTVMGRTTVQPRQGAYPPGDTAGAEPHRVVRDRRGAGRDRARDRRPAAVPHPARRRVDRHDGDDGAGPVRAPRRDEPDARGRGEGAQRRRPRLHARSGPQRDHPRGRRLPDRSAAGRHGPARPDDQPHVQPGVAADRDRRTSPASRSPTPPRPCRSRASPSPTPPRRARRCSKAW